MDPQTQQQYACPLCGHTATEQNDIYVHLQLNHRKSEICDALVELSNGPDEPVSVEQQSMSRPTQY